MVKGLSRRVVIVKAPDTRLFEEAIFILRDGTEGACGGVRQEEILSEARRVAQMYVRRSTRTGGSRAVLSWLPGAVFAAAGGGAVGLLWLACSIFGGMG